MQAFRRRLAEAAPGALALDAEHVAELLTAVVPDAIEREKGSLPADSWPLFDRPRTPSGVTPSGSNSPARVLETLTIRAADAPSAIAPAADRHSVAPRRSIHSPQPAKGSRWMASLAIALAIAAGAGMMRAWSMRQHGSREAPPAASVPAVASRVEADAAIVHADAETPVAIVPTVDAALAQIDEPERARRTRVHVPSRRHSHTRRAHGVSHVPVAEDMGL
jgi:hypothetical protein